MSLKQEAIIPGVYQAFVRQTETTTAITSNIDKDPYTRFAIKNADLVPAVSALFNALNFDQETLDECLKILQNPQDTTHAIALPIHPSVLMEIYKDPEVDCPNPDYLIHFSPLNTWQAHVENFFAYNSLEDSPLKLYQDGRVENPLIAKLKKQFGIILKQTPTSTIEEELLSHLPHRLIEQVKAQLADHNGHHIHVIDEFSGLNCWATSDNHKNPSYFKISWEKYEIARPSNPNLKPWEQLQLKHLRPGQTLLSGYHTTTHTTRISQERPHGDARTIPATIEGSAPIHQDVVFTSRRFIGEIKVSTYSQLTKLVCQSGDYLPGTITQDPNGMEFISKDGTRKIVAKRERTTDASLTITCEYRNHR